MSKLGSTERLRSDLLLARREELRAVKAGERMIIMSGWIFVPPEREAMVQARRTHGCRDFVVAADSLEPGRINVHE